MPRRNILIVHGYGSPVFYSKWSVLIFGPLPPSVGNQYIFLIDDRFTKWHEVIVLPNQSAPTTTKAPVDQWITRFGCPESLHCEQRLNNQAKIFRSLFKLLQLDKTLTTVFHLQSKTVFERTNRTLQNILAKSTDENQRTLSKRLPYVKFACRTSLHESTGYMPYFVLFGHEATPPIHPQFLCQVTLPGETMKSTSLRHGSASTQPTISLIST